MPNRLPTAGLIALVFIAFECGTEATVTSVVVDPAASWHPAELQQSAVKRKRSRQHGRDLIAGSASVLLEANASSEEEQHANQSATAWPLVRRVKRAEVTHSQSSRTEVAELLHKFKKYLDGKYDEVAFHYSPIQRSYENSVKYCIERGSEIADIRTKFEQAEAKALIQNDHKGFVGATTDGAGIWRWNSGFPWSYVGPNQGLDGKDSRKRVVMLSNGAWTEVPRGFLSGVLCREKMFSVVDPDEVAKNTGLVKYFAVNNKCFKIAVRDYVKLGRNEPEFDPSCQDWQDGFDLGTYKNTSHSTQFYTGGSESSHCPDGARRSSNLAIYKTSKAKSVHAVMDETPICNFNIHLVGPESLLLGKETEGGESESTGSTDANQNAESESDNTATSSGTSNESANTAESNTDASESNTGTSASGNSDTSGSTNTNTSSNSDDDTAPSSASPARKSSASPATQKAAVGNSVTMVGAISGIIALVMMMCILAWFWKSRQSSSERSAREPLEARNAGGSRRRSTRRADDRSRSPSSEPSQASFERDETPLPSPRGGRRDRGQRAG